MGPDGCHPHFLKETSDIICEPLEIIFNNSYQACKVPKSGKIQMLQVYIRIRGIHQTVAIIDL